MTSGDQLLTLAPLVKRVAHHVAGPAEPFVDLRDLEQDAYLRCLTALPRYNGSTQLSTFMHPHILGAMIDGLRRWHPRRRNVETYRVTWQSLPATFDDTHAADEPSPEDLAFHTELRTLVDELPAREAHLLREYYFRGRTLDAIAPELGVNESHTSQIKKRALQKLRARLEAA